MDLVVDQVVELEHVDVADRHLAVEHLAGAPVEQLDLARRVEPGQLEHRPTRRPRARRRTPASPSARRATGSAPARPAPRRSCRRSRCRTARRRSSFSLARSSPSCRQSPGPCRLAWMSSSIAPICLPRPRAAQPRCVSKICPTFIRLGTPSGLSTMSTGVPSSRNGMSSCGRMRLMTPLLPWRPAILSPGWSLRFTATNTLTILSTPGGSSSPACSLRLLVLETRVDRLRRLVILRLAAPRDRPGRRRRRPPNFHHSRRGWPVERLVVDDARPSSGPSAPPPRSGRSASSFRRA